MEYQKQHLLRVINQNGEVILTINHNGIKTHFESYMDLVVNPELRMLYPWFASYCDVNQEEEDNLTDSIKARLIESNMILDGLTLMVSCSYEFHDGEVKKPDLFIEIPLAPSDAQLTYLEGQALYYKSIEPFDNNQYFRIITYDILSDEFALKETKYSSSDLSKSLVRIREDYGIEKAKGSR